MGQQLAGCCGQLTAWREGPRPAVPAEPCDDLRRTEITISSPRRRVRHRDEDAPPSKDAGIYVVRFDFERGLPVAHHDPGFARAAGALSCSVGFEEVAFVTRKGKVLFFSRSCSSRHSARRTARLPWPAATVSCGFVGHVALRRGGGAICAFGRELWEKPTQGDPVWDSLPEGPPPADPIVAVDAGHGFFAGLRASGTVFREGGPRRDADSGTNSDTSIGTLPPCQEGIQPISAGAGALRFRRIACSGDALLGETESGILTGSWPFKRLQPAPATAVALPLRCLAGSRGHFTLVDALGCVWHNIDFFRRTFKRAMLPAGKLAVRAAAAAVAPHCIIVVALTDCGELWDCSDRLHCRSISAAQLELPRGLLPYGGSEARRIILIPDTSCGLPRCRLLLLIAGRRLLLPGGLMQRAALVPFLVDEDFIFDQQPPPRRRAAGRAAVGSEQRTWVAAGGRGTGRARGHALGGCAGGRAGGRGAGPPSGHAAGGRPGGRAGWR
eukprot:TRINITY_DN16351_c0_g1_i1.p1 TRINITY_DN16351_c0_g1~~TRINITY_DN16351_c0_g1_i1.p1  ORF type:complete len:534 (+),score=101.47 TRINITY_DN16351_c0_g1_i1:110-1603(+)